MTAASCFHRTVEETDWLQSRQSSCLGWSLSHVLQLQNVHHDDEDQRLNHPNPGKSLKKKNVYFADNTSGREEDLVLLRFDGITDTED